MRALLVKELLIKTLEEKDTLLKNTLNLIQFSLFDEILLKIGDKKSVISL